jgi:hypothetical protein
MKKINDNTIVKVKVPRHLYEAVKARITMLENAKVEEAKEDDEKPKYAGAKMSKTDVLNEVGKSKQNTKLKGAKASAYQPVHSRVYKEGEEMMSESLQDLIQSLSDPQVYKTLGLVATSIGLVGGGKALADMIKKSSSDISGITGAAHGASEPAEPEVNEGISLAMAWIPAAAAALGIGAALLKDLIRYMKENNLKGFKGLMQAYQEVGSSARGGVERSKGV